VNTRLKRWRGLATRYDKHATVYRGALVLAAALLWINDLSGVVASVLGVEHAWRASPSARAARRRIPGSSTQGKCPAPGCTANSACSKRPAYSAAFRGGSPASY
jgi:hypothetical protein